MSPRSVLVVEDERALGEMVRDNLDSAGHRAELVGDGETAIARLGRGGVSLVVLDLMLPGMSGLQVLEQLRRRGDDTPVLVLSAMAQDQDRIAALERGADDYLMKPFNLRELLLRVAALLRRRPTILDEQAPLEFGGNRIDLSGHRLTTWDGGEAELSSTAVKLLRMLAGHEGQAVRREDIVAQLFGPHTPAKVRTLDNVVAQLRKLLERDSRRPRHLHTIRGVGLRLTRDPEDNGD